MSVTSVWVGGVVGANFYPYTLQHSLLDRVSQNRLGEVGDRSVSFAVVDIEDNLKEILRHILKLIEE
jgi:hypothetical protein